MEEEEKNREHAVLERILTLKQMIQEERGGPVEFHELGICFFILENYKQANSALEDLLEKYPDYVEIASAYALKIYCLIQERSYEDAVKQIDIRLKKVPHDITLLALRAHIFEKKGKFRKAIDIHKEILEIDPENINSLNSAGFLLVEHGKDNEQEEALSLITKALKKRPDYPAYLDSLGVFLIKKGKKEQARKAFVKALRKAPGNSEILKHLKELLHVK
ncbi:MAG: tetratricopeptide repeat protein [Spirochaetia bacterium]|nr:tetratricopeptide repeat protein [Spirochaetia bacterium]